MIFEKKYIIESKGLNAAAAVDNASIFELLTSVSKAHTEFIKEALPENIVWMVLDWKLRVHRRPLAGETCSLRTWVSEWNKAFALRCYDITDACGVKCIEASSRWALANVNTRKLFRITSDITDLYEADKGIISLEKAPFIKNIAKDAVLLKSCRAEISVDMLDGNNHVHNTVYSTLSESVLPMGADTDIVDISYRKEIESGSSLILDYCRYENKNLVLIKTEDSAGLNAIVLYGNR